MRRRRSVAVAIGITSLSLWASFSAAQPDSERKQVMSVVGCLIAEDNEWFLTGATAPIPATEMDEGLAPDAEGDHRFRLVGTLDEFGVPKHAGHKVRVKGLITTVEKVELLNVTSLKHLSPSCQP